MKLSCTASNTPFTTETVSKCKCHSDSRKHWLEACDTPHLTTPKYDRCPYQTHIGREEPRGHRTHPHTHLDGPAHICPMSKPGFGLACIVLQACSFERLWLIAFHLSSFSLNAQFYLALELTWPKSVVPKYKHTGPEKHSIGTQSEVEYGINSFQKTRHVQNLPLVRYKEPEETYVRAQPAAEERVRWGGRARAGGKGRD